MEVSRVDKAAVIWQTGRVVMFGIAILMWRWFAVESATVWACGGIDLGGSGTGCIAERELSGVLVQDDDGGAVAAVSNVSFSW
jgi:hypothetical protein